MADSAPALIWMSDARGQLVFANMHYEYVFGRPAATMLGQGWEQVVLAEDLPGYREAFRAAFCARRAFRAEGRMCDRDGQVRWLRCEAVPRLDEAGGFLGYTGCAVDITEARLAAEALETRVAERTAELIQVADALHAAAEERAQVEDVLRQSQKMETVGQLTGGIAHDFNNMLQGIGGSLDMLQRRMAQGRTADADRYAEGARKTVQRAAALTQRLLAFARRQTLQPKPVEPNELIGGMAELVRRTVGPEIEVVLRLGDGIWNVLCDPSQLENALLNIAVNARDAMPQGGRLTIRTADLRLTAADVVGQDEAGSGDYVEVSVADTGTGMDNATRTRAFEPFFTTKPIGQGTGLGLSQVYGFVRQSGGIVHLDSVPGRGTAVRLYLPRHEAANGTGQDGPGAATGVPQAAAGEVVVLVEDEVEVRTAAAERLRDLGYRVLEAGDGPAALRLLRDAPRVDLLVSDVGLPGGLNGRQVADAARERRPNLPVLFITGYAGTFLDGQLAPDMAVLGKPFAMDALAAKARAMLEAAPVN
jgi:PAS domain S-box-containing protein